MALIGHMLVGIVKRSGKTVRRGHTPQQSKKILEYGRKLYYGETEPNSGN